MLSSLLASLGLDSIENGNPHISRNISQERIFNEMRYRLETSRMLDDAIEVATNMVPAHKDGTILITIYQLCLNSSTITQDIDVSKVNTYFILSYVETEVSFVKAHVGLFLL